MFEWHQDSATSWVGYLPGERGTKDHAVRVYYLKAQGVWTAYTTVGEYSMGFQTFATEENAMTFCNDRFYMIRESVKKWRDENPEFIHA